MPLAVNEVYRDGPPEVKRRMYPDISLRYLAAASGVGSLGFSGNLLTNDYGPAIILGGLLTEAELEPTTPWINRKTTATTTTASNVVVAARPKRCTVRIW